MGVFESVGPPEFLVLLFWAIVLVAFAYVLVRVASHAYFRTKLEHLRSVLRELRKGDNNDG